MIEGVGTGGVGRVEPTSEPRASVEGHLHGRVVSLRREVLEDSVVPQHGVVVDASQVVPV